MSIQELLQEEKEVLDLASFEWEPESEEEWSSGSLCSSACSVGKKRVAVAGSLHYYCERRDSLKKRRSKCNVTGARVQEAALFCILIHFQFNTIYVPLVMGCHCQGNGLGRNISTYLSLSSLFKKRNGRTKTVDYFRHSF
jgi:hypothetical protein